MVSVAFGNTLPFLARSGWRYCAGHACRPSQARPRSDPGDHYPDGQLASELADALEVLQALAAVHDLGWEDIVPEAGRKRAERGGFDDRIFLEYVEQTG
jgi:hypothetical protein